MNISLKTKEQIKYMREAGKILSTILSEMAEKVAPGISTFDLDEYAFKRCEDFKVKPAFKGYYDFPACVCISVNEEVVHGIPSKKKILQEGDIVGLDFGVIWKDWYSDSAITVPVGKITPEKEKLLKITKESLYCGIQQAVLGNKIYDIGAAIQNFVEKHGFSVVREFVGHGIGKSLHEEPQVPNFASKASKIDLKLGMVLAIEPMVNLGKKEVEILADGWTVVTIDRLCSAHFEHTVAITEHGPEILTAL